MRNKLVVARVFSVLVLTWMLSFTSADAGSRSRSWSFCGFPTTSCHLGDVNIEIHSGDIVITHDDFDYEEVEITEDYKLYIDGKEIDLDSDQQELVEEFHDLYCDMYSKAKSIGKDGLAIGIDGAKLGLRAVGRVLKMIFTDYDEDDLERDMEREAEVIEAKAEILEDRAEALEDMADELQDLTYEMYDEIPALAALEWF